MHLSREALVKAQHLRLERCQIIAGRHCHAADTQEIREDAIARDRGDGFGMELNAVQFMVTMAEPHDRACLGAGGNGQLVGEAVFLDHQ